jgi:hypothetical protein
MLRVFCFVSADNHFREFAENRVCCSSNRVTASTDDVGDEFDVIVTRIYVRRLEFGFGKTLDLHT